MENECCKNCFPTLPSRKMFLTSHRTTQKKGDPRNGQIARAAYPFKFERMDG